MPALVDAGTGGCLIHHLWSDQENTGTAVTDSRSAPA